MRSSTVACLRRDADLLADPVGVRGDVDAGDGRRALGRAAQGGEDADRGRLAGAVVAEEPEHGARGRRARSRSRRAQRSPNRLPRPFVVTPPPAGAGGTASGRGSCFRTWYETLAVHCTTWPGVLRHVRAGRAIRSIGSPRRSTARPRRPTRRRRRSSPRPTRRRRPSSRRPTRSSRPRRRRSTRRPRPRAPSSRADAHVQATSASAAAALGRVAAQLDALDLWTRTEPGARKPRLGRAELASAAIRVADTEGIDAVSMRRIATELEVGTMTLYHYVRTKDELLALDGRRAAAGGRRPRRRAARRLARRDDRRSRGGRATRCGVTRGCSTSPASRRSARTRCGTSTSRGRRSRGLDADLETKLDVITAVDEYVFGFCLWERQHYADRGWRRRRDGPLHAGAAGRRRLPGAARRSPTSSGSPSCGRGCRRTPTTSDRFDRNLERLLSGFADRLRTPTRD